MKNKPNPRIAAQQSQIRSLLLDFSKIKTKCKQLTDSLGIQLENQNLYKTTERTTLMKMQLLDLRGMVQLKNNLVTMLTQLFDLQRQLIYQQQKQETRKHISPPNHHIQRELHLFVQDKKSSSPIKRDKDMQDNQEMHQESFDSDGRGINSQIRRQKAKIIQIPIYKSMPETNESKLDRISKYIASLKKNLRQNVETAGNKWRFKDYLLEDEQFLKIKQQLQRYQMRQQEIDHLVNEEIKNRIIFYFSCCQLQKNHSYTVIKIYKSNIHKIEEKRKQQDKKLINQPIKQKQSIQQRITDIEVKVTNDFNQIKEDIDRKSQNFNQLVSKISEAVQKGNEKLTKIRQKRKRIFQQDDQIWSSL